jgi:transcriptional regulator with XRE-family HTH domain
MNIDKLKQQISQQSIPDNSWMAKAIWEQENEDWLDLSFEIALKISSILSANKKADIYPRNQVELAETMGCSAQYVSKLMKGKENLQIETICKIGRILKANLIEVPSLEVRQKYVNPSSTFFYTKDIFVTSPLIIRDKQIYNENEVRPVITSYELAA